MDPVQISAVRFSADTAPPPDSCRRQENRQGWPAVPLDIHLFRTVPLQDRGWLHRMLAPVILNPVSLGALTSILNHIYTRPKRIHDMVRFLPESFQKSRQMMHPSYMADFKPYRKVSFKSTDGLALHGLWLPGDNSSKRTVVMGHCYLGDHRMMLGLSQALRREGFNILVFDFRGHGRSAFKPTTMGYHESHDAAGAIRFLSENSPYARQSEELFYLGHSMGSAAWMLAPASLSGKPQDLHRMRQRVRAVVLDSPYAEFMPMLQHFINMKSIYPGNEAMRKLTRFVQESPFVQEILREAVTRFEKEAPRRWNLGIALNQMNPVETYCRDELAGKPTLILHGDRDNVTGIDHSYRIFNRLKRLNHHVEMLELPNTNHYNMGWSPRNDQYTCLSALRAQHLYIKRIVAFLSAHSDKPATPEVDLTS